MTLTDEELMTAVRKDDLTQLSILFDRYQGPLFDFFYRMNGTRAGSDDLVQDVFLRILKYRNTFHENGRFRTWIGTNEPIAGAQLTLTNSTTRRPSPVGFSGPLSAPVPAVAVITTKDDGQFLFDSLDAGSYFLTVVSNGFVRQDFANRAMPLVLTPGQNLDGIAIRLTPAGTVSGQIRDSYGRPVTGVPVQLLRSSFNSTGTRVLQPAESTQTDDLGEFRMFWVEEYRGRDDSDGKCQRSCSGWRA